MDFTREPIIESVITPKEGCKLVVRSSKSTGQEEYFVDALEIVTFGNALFFRSLERPKAFLVPVSDYEVLEVREARMVLKNVGIERSIKIGTKQKEQPFERIETGGEPIDKGSQEAAASVEAKSDGKIDRKRDRRRHSRRKRGASEEGETAAPAEQAVEKGEEPSTPPVERVPYTGGSLLPPPTTLISETIARYRENAMYSGAFYSKEAEAEAAAAAGEVNINEGVPADVHAEDLLESIDLQNIVLEPSEFGTFGTFEEAEKELPPESKE